MNESLVLSACVSALLWSPVLVITHIVCVRLLSSISSLILLFVSFCVYSAAWFISFKLFFQPHGLYVPAVISACSTMIFIFLGYMEFFSMVCRGFSLRILVDIFRKKDLSLEEISREYGEKGMEWMFSKRLETLIHAGLIQVKPDRLQLKGPFSKTLGVIGNTYKSFLNMGKGG